LVGVAGRRRRGWPAGRSQETRKGRPRGRGDRQVDRSEDASRR